jgi:arsenate reductase (thioredoxin)
MATALFVCLHNTGRSQMSAALFERAAEGRHQALSAGTAPGARVHPEVVEVMRELGIDLSHRTPRKLDHELGQQADTKGRPIDEVRATRDDIADRVAALIAELDRT